MSMDLLYWGWEIVSIVDHIWNYLHTYLENALFYNSSNENHNTLTSSILVSRNRQFLWHWRHILCSTWPSAALLLTCSPNIEIILYIYKRVLFSHFYPSLLQRSWPCKGCSLPWFFIFPIHYSCQLALHCIHYPPFLGSIGYFPQCTTFLMLLSLTVKIKAACSPETLLSA